MNKFLNAFRPIIAYLLFVYEEIRTKLYWSGGPLFKITGMEVINSVSISYENRRTVLSNLLILKL